MNTIQRICLGLFILGGAIVVFFAPGSMFYLDLALPSRTEAVLLGFGALGLIFGLIGLTAIILTGPGT